MLCLTSFPVTKTVWIRGEGESIKTFRRQFFGLTVSKVFMGEPFCAAFQENSGSEEVNGYEGDGRVSSFAVENFSSHSV